MKIGEPARRSGLSTHTIRYYEQIGLLPYADRNQSRHRDYDASILGWIEFLDRLKTTGMPIRERALPGHPSHVPPGRPSAPGV